MGRGGWVRREQGGTKSTRTLRAVRADGLAEVRDAVPRLRAAAVRMMHLRQATPAQPNQDHVPQDVLLALRDPLASPADFQCPDGPANILP